MDGTTTPSSALEQARVDGPDSVRGRMKRLYQRLTRVGPDALAELPELYADDVAFYSPIDTRYGLDELEHSWRVAFETYARFGFTDLRVIGTDDEFALFYVMTVGLGVGEPMQTPTATVFRTNDAGKVFYQFDYWDTVGGAAKIHPLLDRAYIGGVARLLGSGPAVAGELPPTLGDDGCHHPASEVELAALVRKCYRDRASLRVVGSAHSVWEAIVPQGFARAYDPRAQVVALDRYRAIRGFRPDPARPGQVLVEVEAGCPLGHVPRLPVAAVISTDAFDNPATPNTRREGDWSESLTVALHERGLALPDLGGVSHPTIGGFLSTGSAGGSCRHSLLDAVESLRVIDGRGEVRVLGPEGDDPEAFAAAGVGMGLCGVISTVTLRCVPSFDVEGRETVSRASEAPDLDFYGPGDAARPSLAAFLAQTEYARVLWWPQAKLDRLVVWRAQRREAGGPRRPYHELGSFSVAKQLAASTVFTLLGNIDPPERRGVHESRIRPRPRARDLLGLARESVRAWRRPAAVDPGGPLDPASGLTTPAVTLGSPWLNVARVAGHLSYKLLGTTARLGLLDPLMRPLARAVPRLIHRVIDPFVELGPDDAPVVQHFRDAWFLGLPLDNGMDDVLVPTHFTEVWIPFDPEGDTVERVIAALRTCFDAGGDVEASYAATGPFCVELYGARGTERFWLSPAYGDKPCLRVNVFWFAHNAEDPTRAFFPRIWRALEPFGGRYHWAKYMPGPELLSPAELAARYPEWARFMAARARLDPRGVFLTDYWAERLGLT